MKYRTIDLGDDVGKVEDVCVTPGKTPDEVVAMRMRVLLTEVYGKGESPKRADVLDLGCSVALYENELIDAYIDTSKIVVTESVMRNKAPAGPEVRLLEWFGAARTERPSQEEIQAFFESGEWPLPETKRERDAMRVRMTPRVVRSTAEGETVYARVYWGLGKRSTSKTNRIVKQCASLLGAITFGDADAADDAQAAGAQADAEK